MNHAETVSFYKGVILGIRPFLSFHHGLVHKDEESILLAHKHKLKIKGYYTLLGFKDSPKIISVYVQVSAGFLSIFANNTEALSMAAQLNANQKVTVRRNNQGILTLEIPKPKHLCWIVPGPKLPLQQDSELVSIGLNVNGEVQHYDFSDSVSAHLFISGMTGSGKTILQKLILAQLARQNSSNKVQFILADYGKAGFNFNDFSRIDHLLYPVLTTIDETYSALSWLLNELNSRKQQTREQVQQLPRIVLMIDEVQDIFNNNPDSIRIARELVAKGREFKLSLVLATQYTNGEYLGDTQILRNMNRLVGKADSTQAAYLLSGVPNSGAEALQGNGDFISISAGNIERFQAALLTPSMVRGIPKQLKRTFSELPETYVEEPTKSRKVEITPEMIAECLLNNTYENLREKLQVGNSVARRTREFTEQLKIELFQRNMKIIITDEKPAKKNKKKGKNSK